MTDLSISFQPILSPTLAIATIVILFIVFSWLEWKRVLKFFPLRLTALMIVMLALLGLILQPSKTESFSSSSIILTSGYEPHRVDSILNVSDKLKMVSAPGVPPYKGSTTLTSWQEVSATNIRYVVGNGLPASARDLLSNQHFDFYPSTYPEGIIQLRVAHPVYAKRQNRVTGVINSKLESTILSLVGPGGVEDSVVLQKKGQHSFDLNFTPKNAGNFVYQIKERNSFEENIPIHVKSEPSSKILFLQQFPTFETQYLKNYLGKNNQLLFRYQVSRLNFRYEYINHKAQRVDRITESLLSEFDLLVIDTDALQSLSGTEKKSLEKSIEAGLGVLILFNENPASSKSAKALFETKFTPFKSDTAQFFVRSKKITLPAWQVNVAISTNLKAITQSKNRILSGYEFHGFGKTGFQFLQETYQLTLRGDSTIYHSIWSDLIGSLARTAQQQHTISLNTPFPIFQNEPLELQVISNEKEPRLFYKNSLIPLKENFYIDDVYTGKFWTDQKGWDTLNIEGDSTKFFFYVSKKDSWASLATANSIHQTKLMANTNHTEERPEQVTHTPYPKWIFYTMFLLGACFLWIVPKL